MVISPWQVPLPNKENGTTPVVVYLYCGRWILITHYRLSDAITLIRRTKSLGEGLYVFPPDLNPTNFSGNRRV